MNEAALRHRLAFIARATFKRQHPFHEIAEWQIPPLCQATAAICLPEAQGLRLAILYHLIQKHHLLKFPNRKLYERMAREATLSSAAATPPAASVGIVGIESFLRDRPGCLRAAKRVMREFFDRGGWRPVKGGNFDTDTAFSPLRVQFDFGSWRGDIQINLGFLLVPDPPLRFFRVRLCDLLYLWLDDYLRYRGVPIFEDHLRKVLHLIDVVVGELRWPEDARDSN